jgi:hypothetical protein
MTDCKLTRTVITANLGAVRASVRANLPLCRYVCSPMPDPWVQHHPKGTKAPTFRFASPEEAEGTVQLPDRCRYSHSGFCGLCAEAIATGGCDPDTVVAGAIFKADIDPLVEFVMGPLGAERVDSFHKLKRPEPHLPHNKAILIKF